MPVATGTAWRTRTSHGHRRALAHAADLSIRLVASSLSLFHLTETSAGQALVGGDDGKGSLTLSDSQVIAQPITDPLLLPR